MFYEDSVITEVKNIDVFGNVASVAGLCTSLLSHDLNKL